MTPRKEKRNHLVYGLYELGQPRIVLYVGSCLEDQIADRLIQHKAGLCRTTARASRKNGTPLESLSLHVVTQWSVHNPEARIMRLMQAMGMARWNFPYVLTSEENARGARNANAIINQRPDHQSYVGRIGGRLRQTQRLADGTHPFLNREHQRMAARASAKAPKPINYHETRQQCGHLGGTAGAGVGMHVRWHINRGSEKSDCRFCQRSVDK